MYPGHTARKVVTFKCPGGKINIDIPVSDQSYVPTQFEIYLYSCLQGRIYSKVSKDGDIVEIRTVMKPTGTDQSTISRTEKLNLHDITVFTNEEKFTEFANRIAEQRKDDPKKIWLDAQMFSNHLGVPIKNLYRVKGQEFTTMITKYDSLSRAIGSYLEPDTRHPAWQEMFSFGFLNAMCLDVSFLFKNHYYDEFVKKNLHKTAGNSGVTFSYIDHIENNNKTS